MNILFLSQVLPFPLDAGPKIRSYYTLRWLAQNNSITLLSFYRKSDTKESVDHLDSFCSRIELFPMKRSRIRDIISFLKSMLIRKPFLIIRDEMRGMNQIIKRLVTEVKFDAIHADQLWMAAYALLALNEAKNYGYQPFVILDQHNAVYQIPSRMADSARNLFSRIWLNNEANLMAQYEKEVCRKFDRVVWVTQEDLNAVSQIKVNSSRSESTKQPDFNTIIPICTDTTVNTPVKSIPKAESVLFIGGMHWPPNAEGVVWFLENVFPIILKTNPQAKFLVIGKNPPAKLKLFGSQVIVPGYVERTDEYWAQSRIFIVPLLAGGGMRVKILDAWVKGLPIVSTTIGAEGISYTHEKDILIADSPEDFARSIIKIMLDDDYANLLREAGRKTVSDRYDWRKIYPAWNDAYKIKSHD